MSRKPRGVQAQQVDCHRPARPSGLQARTQGHTPRPQASCSQAAVQFFTCSLRVIFGRLSSRDSAAPQMQSFRSLALVSFALLREAGRSMPAR